MTTLQGRASWYSVSPFHHSRKIQGSDLCLSHPPRVKPFSLAAGDNVGREKDHTEAQAGMQQNFNELEEGKEVL